MIGMISPVSRSMPMGNVSSIYNYRLVQRAQRQAMPEAPVTPVRPAPPVYSEAGGRVTLPWQDTVHFPGSKGIGAEGAQQTAEEGECQTCKERKYQDGSDDSSVSYQSPTHIDADYAPAAVRGHELEHVAHEQAKAQKEDRKVVSQTVTLHTDICPECGRVYVSGGTTRTVTKANNTEAPAQEEQGGAEK